MVNGNPNLKVIKNFVQILPLARGPSDHGQIILSFHAPNTHDAFTKTGTDFK